MAESKQKMVLTLSVCGWMDFHVCGINLFGESQRCWGIYGSRNTLGVYKIKIIMGNKLAFLKVTLVKDAKSAVVSKNELTLSRM